MPPKDRRASPPHGANKRGLDSSRNLDASHGRKLERGASNVGAYASGLTPEEEAVHEAIMKEHARHRHDLESEESHHRQRHEALEAVGMKFIHIEFTKLDDPLGYYKQTKPCETDEVSKHQCTVKLMTCNRAMKPFSIKVPLPSSDSDLDALTLAEFKERVFEAAKTNYVDPVMLPLLRPQMQALYSLAGKQIGRVEDKEAMDRWLAAHPPPTKKLTAAERAALPVPPPMPTIESPEACVREFDVAPGAVVYLAVRVAPEEIVGTDAHASASSAAAAVSSVAIPPVNPRDKSHLKKKHDAAAAAAAHHASPAAAQNSASPSASPASTQRRR